MKAVAVLALGVVAGLLLGYVVHPFGEGKTTFATFSDTERTLVNASADIPLPACDVIFANKTTGATTLAIGGKNNTFGGCIQSNSGVTISGTGNRVNRTVRYNTTFSNTGSAVLVNGSIRVPTDAYPWPYTLASYSPAGCRAAAAASYTSHAGDWNPGALTEGLHYVTGNANVDASGFTGRVTIVALGTVTLKTNASGVKPYIDNLTAIAGASTSNAFTHTGGGGRESGAMFAPDGDMTWSATNTLFSGTLMARTIAVTSNGNTFTARAPAAHATC